MKTKIALSLLLGATAAFAGEMPFHTPTTDRAQQTQQLLNSAAQAVRAREQHVSNLWVFPTAGPDTVFVQYEVNSNSPSAKAPAVEQHLEVLTLEGGRIVSRRDLTHSTI